MLLGKNEQGKIAIVGRLDYGKCFKDMLSNDSRIVGAINVPKRSSI